MARGFEVIKEKLGETIYDYFWDEKVPHDLGDKIGRCHCNTHIRYEHKIINRKTGEEHVVGSSCILNFMEYVYAIPQKELLKRMNRLEFYARRDRSLDLALKKAAQLDNWFRKREQSFREYYYDHNRKLTTKQLDLLEDILKNQPEVDDVKNLRLY